jgi:hypothetical protein
VAERAAAQPAVAAPAAAAPAHNYFAVRPYKRITHRRTDTHTHTHRHAHTQTHRERDSVSDDERKAAGRRHTKRDGAQQSMTMAVTRAVCYMHRALRQLRRRVCPPCWRACASCWCPRTCMLHGCPHSSTYVPRRPSLCVPLSAFLSVSLSLCDYASFSFALRVLTEAWGT